jgi:hypothetical protein
MNTSSTDKGLLTPDNCAVILIDYQPQMVFGVANIDRQTLFNNTLLLAKAAKTFGVPVILTTVETKGFSGNMWPQLLDLFPDHTPVERSSMNSGTTRISPLQSRRPTEEPRHRGVVDRSLSDVPGLRRWPKATRCMRSRMRAAARALWRMTPRCAASSRPARYR